jgi:signal transduction histidine kinase
MNWKTLHRSMIGQMLILVALFCAWGVYTAAVLPWPETRAVQPLDPVVLTSFKVRDTISNFVFEGSASRPATKPIDQNPIVREVIAANPGFRYYIKARGKVYGNAGKPRYFEEDSDRPSAVVPKKFAPCRFAERDVSSAEGRGYMVRSDCGEPYFYEYYGLKSPIDVSDAINAKPETKWIAGYIKTFLQTVGGLVLLFGLVLIVNMIMIRRVARLAKSFDPEKITTMLPERGLPVEVVPLVRAVNHMIARVRETHTRQSFFLSAAAHEMRTPLTVLRTRLELLDDGPAKDTLVKDVRRMTGLINQLLMLMAVEESERSTDEINLVACVRRAIAAREPLTTDRGVKPRFESKVPAYPMRGDAPLLEVAIANLIENAMIFSPDGGEVLVTLDADGTVTVRDHGPGVAEAHLASLFQPFVRFSSHRGGHGLGLAITKAIATRHHGRISVANAPSGGAVFTLQLDRHDPVEPLKALT